MFALRLRSILVALTMLAACMFAEAPAHAQRQDGLSNSSCHTRLEVCRTPWRALLDPGSKSASVRLS